MNSCDICGKRPSERSYHADFGWGSLFKYSTFIKYCLACDHKVERHAENERCKAYKNKKEQFLAGFMAKNLDHIKKVKTFIAEKHRYPDEELSMSQQEIDSIIKLQE